jgi:outer membrane protein OmpA-like peptidoglycan-associated protein
MPAAAAPGGWTLADGGWWASVAPIVVTGAPGEAVAGLSLSNDLLFEFGSSTLGGPARDVIAGVTADLLTQGVSVSIHGFTDTVGTDDVNLPLSRERARAVGDAMVDAGFPTDRIVAVEGHGSADPRAIPADTPSNRALNRRVEIRPVG